MVGVAYDNDPRILAERAKENAEHEAKKQAKKDAKTAKYKEQQDLKLEQERLKKEAEEEEVRQKKIAADQKKEIAKLYRLTCREFNQYCVSKMPNSKYDKYYIDEFVKKYPKQPLMDALFEKVRGFKDDTFEDQFIELLGIKKPEVKEETKNVQAEQNNVAAKAKNWTEEDVQNLTKAIVKLPAGTINRWKVISDEVGKSQKEVIQKAKEIQARQQEDVAARRQEE